MTPDQISYLVFGIVVVIALIFDMGLFSKKNTAITLKTALWQSVFWVMLGLGYFVFLIFEENKTIALEYLSAYFMEKSLSIDNIFVFVLIFNAFRVKEIYYGRSILFGVLMAIVFRVIFITVGVELVNRFHWILYIFGVFLAYTGLKMFTANDEAEFDPKAHPVYKWMKRVLPLVPHDGNGRYIIKENGKRHYTMLFVVVVMLSVIDLVFALDSIPAVMGISTNKMVIYTSNIFAVLGLRSLFFLLRGAVNKFDYLQQGIAIVLVFIGLKMLGEHWISDWFTKSQQVIISLIVIVLCITGSIVFSVLKKRKGVPAEVKDGSIDL
ncbi:MAG TPA: TerC/Alx family metal homeostasis membrane protein [Niabella sp.]|nr:TerC/Alx family metal homeostasis membrane protein [Niabella sp.]HOZ95575.1 TerC/Alx family metal homeostasis membrane protein [Niabella sp.]HQW13815.1 TerC/Alx family metal homeostasis membrane protein [Niabella sp.]HQX19292.1 TerC/Alx family metal homeostasis membrane protein [Niabella sp.]HQX41644.1 TerC/Alx family metal homeostasis membrane protein [Niabella sp.]